MIGVRQQSPATILSAGIMMVSLVAFGCYTIIDDGECVTELTAAPLVCVSVNCGEKDLASLMSYDMNGTTSYGSDVCVCTATQWEVIEVPVPGDPNETVAMCGGGSYPPVPPPGGYGQGGSTDSPSGVHVIKEGRQCCC